MKTKIKIILIFVLGLITPILVIIFLCGALYINSVDRLNTFDLSIYREFTTFIKVDRITLVDLYRASSLSELNLISNIKTGINEFKTTLSNRERPANRPERIRNNFDFSNRIQPLITKLQNFEIEIDRPNLLTGERISAIDDQLQNIDELINKLKSANINFSEEIQKLQEIKGNLVALKAALSLTPEEKENLKTSIISAVETLQSQLPVEINDQVSEIYNGAIGVITPEQQVEILIMENTELNNKITSLELELEAAKTKIEELTIELKTANAKIDKLNIELNLVKARNEKLNIELSLEEAKNQALTDELKDSSQEIRRLNARITVLEGIVGRLNNNDQTNDDTINALETEINDLNNEIAALEEQLIPISYDGFESYLFDGDSAPIISDFNKEYSDIVISSISTTKTNDLYSTITITSSTTLSSEQINYLISLITLQLAKTNYNSNIEVIFQPNNVSINLSQTAIIDPI